MFTQETVALILAIISGPAVVGVVEMIKRFLVARLPSVSQKLIGYAVAALVSFGGTAYFLLTSGAFTWPAFAGYGILVFLEANGIYKATS